MYSPDSETHSDLSEADEMILLLRRLYNICTALLVNSGQSKEWGTLPPHSDARPPKDVTVIQCESKKISPKVFEQY